MKLKSDTSLWLRRAGAAAVLAASSQAGATTVITSDGTPWTKNNAVSAISGYGSNVPTSSGYYTVSAGATGVVGTPGITVAFNDIGTGGQGWDQYTAWDGSRGNVIQMESTTNAQTIVFTPIAGQAVALASALFDEWSGGGTLTINWTVSGATSGTLATGTWTRSTGGQDLVNFGATGALGEAVTLSMTRTSGSSSYFAIDNLTFDQVPEPASAAMGLIGLGALAMRRRRNA